MSEYPWTSSIKVARFPGFTFIPSSGNSCAAAWKIWMKLSPSLSEDSLLLELLELSEEELDDSSVVNNSSKNSTQQNMLIQFFAHVVYETKWQLFCWLLSANTPLPKFRIYRMLWKSCSNEKKIWIRKICSGVEKFLCKDFSKNIWSRFLDINLWKICPLENAISILNGIKLLLNII